MYKQFYGLKDVPFNLAPDPKYLFRTDSLLEVFATLQYGIDNSKGLVVVTGEVGTGKTTILRSMLQSLDRTILAAYIFNPLLSSKDFFDLLSTEFRIQPQASKAAMLRRLGELLVTRHQQGLTTVLVIDEAHLLAPHLLEEIRLLSNFETTREKLLQIILCGQPELHETLSRPEQRQLKQRVSLKCSIKSLTPRETAEYIRWRLRIAGARNENLFEPDAVKLIQQLSGGIPRIINNLCDNALLTGYGKDSPTLTRNLIQEVADDLDLMPVDYGTLSYTVADIDTEVDKAFARFSSSASQPSASPTNVLYLRDNDKKMNPESEPLVSQADELINAPEWETPIRFFKRVHLK